MFKSTTLGVLLVIPISAMAHLTWVSPEAGYLKLSTGHHFPTQELEVVGQYIDRIQCQFEPLGVKALATPSDSAHFSLPSPPENCLAQLKATQITLTTKQGVQHLSENKVDPALVNKAKRNEQFIENYFKSAQLKVIQIDSPLYQPDIAQFVSKPNSGDDVYLFRNGSPLAGVSVGLEHPQIPITLWSKTDTNGKVKLLLKPQGPALLRALITEDKGDSFSSQFVSVLIDR